MLDLYPKQRRVGNRGSAYLAPGAVAHMRHGPLAGDGAVPNQPARAASALQFHAGEPLRSDPRAA